MWAIFMIPFAVVVVAGALLLGWGVPFIAIIGVALVGAAVVFAFQRTAVEPTTQSDGGHAPTWATKHWWE